MPLRRKRQIMDGKREKISEVVIRRLTDYLRCLKFSQVNGQTLIKSTEISTKCGFTSSIIRKDLAQFGAYGVKGTGYNVIELIAHLNKILGLDNTKDVILIGAGNLGTAIIKYPGFRSVNFNFIAAFDNDLKKVGEIIGNTKIYHIDQLNGFIKEHQIEIVVLTPPSEATLEIVNSLDSNYVKGILNFTSIILPNRKNSIHIHNIDLAKELEVISFCMKNCLS